MHKRRAVTNWTAVANFWRTWESWLWPAILVAAAVLLSLAAHYLVFLAGKRIAKRAGGVFANSLAQHAEAPTRWIFPLIAIIIVLPYLPVRSELVEALQKVAGLGVIASIAWAVMLLAAVLGDVAFDRYRVDISNNLTARRIRTQIAVLRRIFNVVVIVITIGFMLMTFPNIRQLGASVLASAGIAGLVLGVAMKSTLSNLIAGVQIALTEPIRIEDVVIVKDEWGWIEEILTTYVVVRTWDLRRLIVPLSYFIENTFQNWTLNTADLLTYAYIYCDYTAPVDELRQEFQRILESSPLWDRKVASLQVVDSSERTMKIRALTSASDSGKASDLGSYVREKLIQFLQEKHPECLPTSRVNYRAETDEAEHISSPPPRQLANGQPASRLRKAGH